MDSLVVKSMVCNTRSLAKENHSAGLYGHALSLAVQNRFSAKEFLDKAGEVFGSTSQCADLLAPFADTK